MCSRPDQGDSSRIQENQVAGPQVSKTPLCTSGIVCTATTEAALNLLVSVQLPLAMTGRG